MKPTLVLADDHEMLLDGLERLLVEHYDVVARVKNGKELVEAVSRLRPAVVVSDVSMPEMDGLRATRKICQLCPQTRVVLVSMRHDPATARQALQLGASAYVLKTEASDRLLFAIAKALDGGVYIGPALREGDNAVAEKPIAALTQRQLEVLQQLGKGLTMKAIGSALSISPRTVAFHKYRVMEQLGIETNAELLRYIHSLDFSEDRNGPGLQ